MDSFSIVLLGTFLAIGIYRNYFYIPANDKFVDIKFISNKTFDEIFDNLNFNKNLDLISSENEIFIFKTNSRLIRVAEFIKVSKLDSNTTKVCYATAGFNYFGNYRSNYLINSYL